LCYLATVVPTGSLVVDVGCELGMTALAMGCNKHVPVFAYNPVDAHANLLRHSHMSAFRMRQRVPNVFFTHGDVLAPRNARVLLSAAIIFLDARHLPYTEPFERAFFDFLIENCYAGLLVVNDIRINDEMRRWWSSIPLKKYDVTRLGRPSGTGIVDFSGVLAFETQ
jgi:hypothetical protein